MSFSSTTHFREDTTSSTDRPRTFSSGDEEFEKLEIKRRLTIVPPISRDDPFADDDEENDIAYDDELIYDDDEDDVEGEEFYERYSDDEDAVRPQGEGAPLEEEESIVEEIPTPQTFEELNDLYKPKYEEKLTTIQSSMAAREEKSKLSPSLSNAPRISPAPVRAAAAVIQKEDNSPPVPVKSQPAEEPRRSPLPAQGPQAPHEYEDDEDEYSDELYDEDGEEPVSDVDDEDLMRRLEAKYGKLPNPPAVGDEDEEEQPLDSDYDVDDDPTWTSKVK